MFRKKSVSASVSSASIVHPGVSKSDLPSRTTVSVTRESKRLRTEHLRYIRREAAAAKAQKLQDFRAKTEAALQVFDDTAVMVRFADILSSRGGAYIQKQLIDLIIGRLRDGRTSAKHNVIGIDLSKIPEFIALRSNFQKSRDALNEAYEAGVQKIEQSISDVVDGVYLDSMPDECAEKVRLLRELPIPGLPQPAVV